MRTPKDAEAEWLQRVADIEDEVGGFPVETGVITRHVQGKEQASQPAVEVEEKVEQKEE